MCIRDRVKEEAPRGSHRGWRNWRNKPACMRQPRIRRKSGSSAARDILGKGPKSGSLSLQSHSVDYARRPQCIVISQSAVGTVKWAWFLLQGLLTLVAIDMVHS